MQLASTRTYNIPDDVMEQICHDLITTAVEGGIKYWAVVRNYRWGARTLGHSHTQANGNKDWQDTDRPYVMVEIAEPTGDDEDPTWHQLDTDRMAGAVKKLVSGEVPPFHTLGYTKTYRDRLIDMFTEIENGAPLDMTDYDFDADDADCMLQIAVLGAVIYG